MQALSARTPSYFTNKSLQAYRHATAAGKSSLPSISSPQLSVFSVAPECHPDHRNSPLDIQIPAPPFSPSCTCCLFVAPRPPPILLLASCTFCSFATSFSCFTPLQTSSLVTSSRARCSPALSSAEFFAVPIPHSTSAAAPTLHALPQPLFLPVPHTALS